MRTATGQKCERDDDNRPLRVHGTLTEATIASGVARESQENSRDFAGFARLARLGDWIIE